MKSRQKSPDRNSWSLRDLFQPETLPHPTRSGGLIVLRAAAQEDATDRKVSAFGADGTKLWDCVFPAEYSQTGVIVGISSRDRRLFLNTWDCYQYELDLASGVVISKTFTK